MLPSPNLKAIFAFLKYFFFAKFPPVKSLTSHVQHSLMIIAVEGHMQNDVIRLISGDFSLSFDIVVVFLGWMQFSFSYFPLFLRFSLLFVANVLVQISVQPSRTLFLWTQTYMSPLRTLALALSLIKAAALR